MMRNLRLAERLGTSLVILLLGGLLGATLVRLGPGFGTDERELDPRLSPQGLAALRKEKAAQSNIVRFYGRYLGGLVRGDLGVSASLNLPVADLLRERWAVTACTAGLGLGIGWLAGLFLAIFNQFARVRVFDPAAGVFSTVLLSTPAAVLAICFAHWRAPATLAISAVVLPRVFRYARNLIVDARLRPHVLTAVAKGVAPARVVLWHVLPPVTPQLIALLGVSLNLAFTAAIPIEALCDVPGLGQLAWQAALSRDLPVLVSVTLVLAAVTLAANMASECINERGAS
jgi:peptide/nickel transport system permease protein